MHLYIHYIPFALKYILLKYIICNVFFLKYVLFFKWSVLLFLKGKKLDTDSSSMEETHFSR